jgi:hypothetical protein
MTARDPRIGRDVMYTLTTKDAEKAGGKAVANQAYPAKIVSVDGDKADLTVAVVSDNPLHVTGVLESHAGGVGSWHYNR